MVGLSEAIPDERMSFTGSPPTGRVMLIGDLRRPVRAVNKEGDCLELLNARDGRFSSAFFPRGWLGYAREHFLELEFPSDTNANQVLVLHGGVDYPYPESILAAEQAGVGLVAPTLEVKRSGEIFANSIKCNFFLFLFFLFLFLFRSFFTLTEGGPPPRVCQECLPTQVAVFREEAEAGMGCVGGEMAGSWALVGRKPFPALSLVR
jgi:hypothetical protein